MNHDRLINVIAFVVLMISTLLGIQALWGILFLYWVFYNYQSGQAFLISAVGRKSDPFLYWAIQTAWVVLGLALVITDFSRLA